MRKLTKLFSIVLGILLTMPFVTSCGDDESIDLGTPKYESISGKYTIDTPSSPYKSIELGASGDYIVTLNTGYNTSLPSKATLKKEAQGIFKQPKNLSRATNYNGIIYGQYTENSDGTLNLEGFGVIEIVYGTGKEVKGFNLTPTNGGPVTLDVTKEETMPDDDLTNALCRTWKIEKIRITGQEDDESYDITLTPENIKEFGDDFEEFPQEVLFSKSGTYMIYYSEQNIGISSWKWKDQAAGTISYSWDNYWEDDAFVTLSFSGNRLVIYEVHEENDEYGYYKEENYTYLIEK